MNPPTPTPLASTAMEAAREIDREADFGGKLTPTNAVTEISAIIQKHFQPLLAKVEGEKAAKDHVPFSNAELVAQVLALRADLAAAKQERDASMEILDTVARGFERALARVLAWDRFGAENELKLAIAHVDNPHSYTGKSMAQLRADLAAKEAALGEMKSDLKREVELNDKMAKQRVPIYNDDVREFVLMALCQHTLLNGDERQDCAEQILTAFAPACEELKHSVSELMDALAAKLAALKHVGGVLNKNGNWDDGCFYYNRVSAPELQDCLAVIDSALASRADKGGAR